jgi:DNA invertase Pin-like site-specific DNA recombinase
MERADRVRCAIYTRKSSEEGLSQSFNSLHSQREYCEAFIKSQGGEGWTLVRQRYDDGGFSGANLTRPGLQRLLADIDAKLIDAVVVYKVDRLTRSLADFARILERLDKQGAAFVSVTQAFNTNSSMGRLTLNVLLSFAQFERDVTGERIRDKIAASKAKGMWMGGVVPLGYDPPDDSGDRRLRVNETEAVAVRSIFERLIQCRSFYDLQQQLMEDGIRSKPRRSPRGAVIAGLPFSRGALRHLLQNKIYLGLICHKGEVHDGRHEAIVDRSTFDAVQALLQHRSAAWKRRAPDLERPPLQGKLFDALGQRMKPVFTRRRGRLYSYYVAAKLMPGLTGQASADALTRVPCQPLDDLIRRRLIDLTGEGPETISTQVLRQVVTRVEVHGDSVQMVLSLKALRGLSADLGDIRTLEARLRLGDRLLAEASRLDHARISIPIRMKMRGGRAWLEGAEVNAGKTAKAASLAAIKRLREAHSGFEPARPALGRQLPRILVAKAPLNDIARIDWVFLAPDMQSAILNGRLDPAAIGRIENQGSIPLSWAAQRRLLEPDLAIETPDS